MDYLYGDLVKLKKELNKIRKRWKLIMIEKNLEYWNLYCCLIQLNKIKKNNHHLVFNRIWKWINKNLRKKYLWFKFITNFWKIINQ